MKIPYIIKSRKGTRGIRISVHADGAVVVTKSKAVPRVFAEAYVRSKAHWIEEKIKELEKRPKKLLAHCSMKDYKENKERTRVLVHSRVKYFSQFYPKFSGEIKSINIRNQKTRWGSCSKDKNISFNYKIIFLSPELQDYIIVHELCHIQEMNHGKRFWDLVSLQIPDHKRKRLEIKKY